jgi:hypothetical protein
MSCSIEWWLVFVFFLVWARVRPVQMIDEGGDGYPVELSDHHHSLPLPVAEAVDYRFGW